jgi:hypothetical protein
MRAEVTLKYYAADEMPDYHEEIEVSCGTELANYAYELQRRTGAEFVSFNRITGE